MPKVARQTRGQEEELGIRTLVSYRLSRTATLMSRGAALRYRREFDVSLGEWRALALLASDAPQTLMQLSRAAGLDKAQTSRVVASLINRGLVLRATAAKVGRAAELNLTRRGRVVYGGLIAAAAERDRAFRAVLTPDEHVTFNAIMEKLAAQAQAFIKMESAPAAAQSVSTCQGTLAVTPG